MDKVKGIEMRKTRKMRTCKLPSDWSFYVGQEVRYHPVIDEAAHTSGHRITHIEIRHGLPIAFITGQSGFVGIEFLTPESEA